MASGTPPRIEYILTEGRNTNGGRMVINEMRTTRYMERTNNNIPAAYHPSSPSILISLTTSPHHIS